MSSRSEKSFGARLGNARIFLSYLETFSRYTPPAKPYAPPEPELSVDAYHTIVNQVSAIFDEVDGSIHDYTIAVGVRQKVFDGDDGSLKKVLSPVGAAIRQSFGKSSKEATTVASLIAKLRGLKKNKNNKKPDTAFISQSERGYNSTTQKFSGLIASLDKSTSTYNPSNENVRIEPLRALLQKLIENNLAVANKLLAVRQQRDSRSKIFDQLNKVTQRCKASILSLYLVDSIEYKSVKGLVI